MTADQRFFGLCALVYGALFLACCFAAGLVTGHAGVWQVALLSMLAAFLCFYCQLAGRRGPAICALAASWGFAAGALGILLVVVH